MSNHLRHPRRRVLGGIASLAAARNASAAPAGEAAPHHWVEVDKFRTPASADDTEAIRLAIAEARQTGGVVVFAGREYCIAGTVQLPSGVRLQGTGAVLGSDAAHVPGTVLRRVRDCVMLYAEGVSFLSGGPLVQAIGLSPPCQ